jgi:hypothetical protein
MWAFGVLFYFMLNMEFPFSIFRSIKNSILIGSQKEKKSSFVKSPKISAIVPSPKRLRSKSLLIVLLKLRIFSRKFLILILIIESLSLIFVSIQSSGNIFQWFNRLQKFSIVKSSSLVKLLEIQKLQLQTSQNQSNKKIISEEL